MGKKGIKNKWEELKKQLASSVPDPVRVNLSEIIEPEESEGLPYQEALQAIAMTAKSKGYPFS